MKFIVLGKPNSEEVEITLFTIFFQGIEYLIMIGIANLFYYLGYVSELIIGPKNSEKYRDLTYKIGYWFSCGLPFLIPISIFIEFI